MRRTISRLLLTAVCGLIAAYAIGSGSVGAAGSLFMPGRYSNDPATGLPVTQYAEKAPSYVVDDPTYRRSGYVRHHYRTRGADGSTSRTTNVIESWGTPWNYWGYTGGRYGGYPRDGAGYGVSPRGYGARSHAHGR